MKVFALLALCAVASAIPQNSAWIRIHGSRNSPRITGGQEAVPNSHPHQVGLNIVADDGTYFCGGSILSNKTVITAAHCCELTDNIQVVAGAHAIRNTSEETQQVVDAAVVTIHPSWNSQNLENDICILTLAQELNLNDVVAKIRLPTREQQNENFAGRTSQATGWGLDSDSATAISPVLREVDVPVLTNAQCRSKFGIIGIGLPLHPSNVCTDGAEGKSTCSGDSGGPLTVPDNLGKPQLIGLTSFGISLGCEKNYPAVFTRITTYLDWISLTTGIEIEN